MSSSFPPIPGFVGPLSLKAFLEEYFSLRLTFAVPPISSSSGATARADSRPSATGFRAWRDVVLPPNQSFLLVVYVALNASSSPPPAAASISVTPGASTPSLGQSSVRLGWHRQPLVRHAAPAATHDVGVKRGKSSNVCAPRRSSASWLLYTNTSHRPFTDALLCHPWWGSFAACMGPPAMGFIEMFCPIILQLEAMAGGVQVLGPPLKSAVSEAPVQLTTPSTERRGLVPRGGACVASRGVKRSYDQSGCIAPLPPLKEARTGTGEAPPQGKGGLGPQQEVIPCGGVCRGNRYVTAVNRVAMSAPWTVTLTCTDAPRTRLYSVRVSDMDVVDDRNSDRPSPLPTGFLEAQWLCRHPQSLHRVLLAALPKRLAYRVTRTRHSTGASTEGVTRRTTLENIPMRHVAHIFRWLVLQPPQKSELASQTSSPKFDLASHLCQVVSTVVDQCSLLDLRGAALRHTGYLEETFSRQQQGVLPWDVQHLAAPVGLIVSYLRTLLSSLRWAPSTGATELSFWGLDAAGSERVLDALMKAVKGWLGAGRHAVVPVSRFLDGVPVAQVPWLHGFYSTHSSSTYSATTAAASRHARRQRSQVQQRVWLQFALFLTQDILPFLLRRSFIVTWSSKNTHTLLFFPVRVWRQLVRREIRRAQPCAATDPRVALPLDTMPRLSAKCHTSPSVSPVSGGGAAADALVLPHPFTSDAPAAVSTPRLVWRAIRTCRAFTHRGKRATLATRGGGASCLYAGVRFCPDGRKLRPIAVVRSASLRSLEKMARGSPSPYSYANTIVRLLCRLGLGDKVDQLPVATAKLLRHVQARNSHARFTSVPRFAYPSTAHLPHKAALRDALRCLVSGVEEKRVLDGLPRLSNLSHHDEYTELRSFCEEVRVRDAFVCNDSSGTASAAPRDPPQEAMSRFGPRFMPCELQTVTLVRSDASRCYDNLPQERVLQAVATLVKHDAYRVLCFTAIHAPVAPPACESDHLLRRVFTTRTIPLVDVERGVLARVPRGHIFWEEGDRGTQVRPHTAAADSHGGGVTSRWGANVISGAAVRSLLREHIRHHLVVVSGGSLFEQRVGILQGSPVAMLLCDYLFADVVDTALSCILSEHEERSLLLRRVDDVLVATASPTAAKRCFQAMQRGWPSVGYLSNPNKLTLSSARGNLIPWCGLLLHDTTLEFSVEWRRIGTLLAYLRVSDLRYAQRGDREPLHFTQRFLSMLQLRVAPTVLCGRMNSKSRQLQTFYEIGLLWSRLVLGKVQETLPVAHDRRIAVLLLRPLAACIGRLLRLLGRHQQFLKARQSACGLSIPEVRACVLTALHRTLQAKLRMLQAHAIRVIVAQRGSGQHGAPFTRCARNLPIKRASSAGGRGYTRRRHGQRRPPYPRVCLRSFWWIAAAEVESQWRRSLSTLLGPGPQAGGACDSTDSSTVQTAYLLMEEGPKSMHVRALGATRLSRN